MQSENSLKVIKSELIIIKSELIINQHEKWTFITL